MEIQKPNRRDTGLLAGGGGMIALAPFMAGVPGDYTFWVGLLLVFYGLPGVIIQILANDEKRVVRITPAGNRWAVPPQFVEIMLGKPPSMPRGRYPQGIPPGRMDRGSEIEVRPLDYEGLEPDHHL